MTIELEHIGGEKKYNAPPLPKGEILGGIAGILDNEVYRTRPRALDLYGMYHNSPSAQTKTGRDRKGSVLSTIDPFDVSKLSSAYGPKTTETLIDAIFNPVPSHSERPSPFTYYVPLDQAKKTVPLSMPASLARDTASSINGHQGHRRKASVHSNATSNESQYEYVESVGSSSHRAPSMSSRSASGHSFSSHGHGGSEFGHGTASAEERQKPWWKKIGSVGHSRPGTPALHA